MSLSELRNAAHAASAELSQAELHGTVCGMLVGNLRISGTEGGSEHFSVDEYVALVGADALADAITVEDFSELSRSALVAEDLSFQPLLPEDHEPLNDRVVALAEWCAGFLAGLGAVKGGALNETEAEVLDDFVAISSVDADVEDNDDGERQLTELVEYVRVATLSLLMPADEDDE